MLNVSSILLRMLICDCIKKNSSMESRCSDYIIVTSIVIIDKVIGTAFYKNKFYKKNFLIKNIIMDCNLLVNRWIQTTSLKASGMLKCENDLLYWYKLGKNFSLVRIFWPFSRKNPRFYAKWVVCLLYTSPSPRDKRQSRMPSSA